MRKLKIECEEELLDRSALEACAMQDLDTDVTLAVEIVFVSEEQIRSLNAETRGKDAVTDVLSYPNLDGIFLAPIRKKNFPFDLDEEGDLVLGSIVICRARAAQQAEEYGHSLQREVHYLAVHGLCHLLGYDHETPEQKAQMRAREEAVLSAMGYVREGDAQREKDV